MNFFKKLFGGSDSISDSTKEDRHQIEQTEQQKVTFRHPRAEKQEDEREEKRDNRRPSRRNQGEGSERPRRKPQDDSRRSDRPNNRNRRSNNRRPDDDRPRRIGSNASTDRRMGSNNSEQRGSRRPRRQPRQEQPQRPRATKLSSYVLTDAPVKHDEEQDRWRSLDLRNLDTIMPESLPKIDIPEGTKLPKVMREAIEKSLVWVSYDEDLPEITYDEEDHKLISGTEEQQHSAYFAEPSTIWTEAPVEEGDGGRLKYSPSYLEFTPEQRYEYLDWLTRKDKSGKWGYVFLYYNGLERHLLIGDIDRAVEEILGLRETFPWQHKLTNASEYAVINSCYARRRKDLLLKLIDEGSFRGISLLRMTISYESDINLGTEDLLNIFYKLYPEARKALHHDRSRLREHVKAALNKLTLYDGLPIYRYPIDEVKTKNEHRFLNDSFPEYLRGCVMPDFYSLDPFLNDVDLIFHTAFDAYKSDPTAATFEGEDDDDEEEDKDDE